MSRLLNVGDNTQANVIERLAALGVDYVALEYYGSGDSGGIEGVTARTAGAGAVEVNLPADLLDLVREFAYEYLGDEHGGWENNEGGSGEITIDVPGRKMTMHHNENVISTDEYDHEKDFGQLAEVAGQLKPPLSPPPVCTCASLVHGHQPACPYIIDRQKKGL